MTPPKGKNYLGAPVIVNWGLTSKCNFNCAHCFSRGGPGGELAPEDALKAADVLAAARVLFVSFGTGEPLLRPDLFDVASRLKGSGVRVAMNSNGWLLAEPGTAERARDAGFTSINISIDHPEAGTHDKFREKKGSHERALKAAGMVVKSGIALGISTVVSSLNLGELGRIVELAKRAGAKKLMLHNYKCSGKGYVNRADLDLEPQLWRKFYAEAIEVRDREKALELDFDDPIICLLGPAGKKEEAGSIRGSSCGKVSLYIGPCGFMPEVIGNILKDDFLKVWEESRFLHRVRNKVPKGKCVSCVQYESCLGGCTARALAVSGEVDAPDPHCWHEQDSEELKS